MLLSVDALESEICKLRGLLQMLHEDQPDVLDDVFQFHVGNLISHAAPDQHGHIRNCARDMLDAIRAVPTAVVRPSPEFQLMPQLLARPA